MSRQCEVKKPNESYNITTRLAAVLHYSKRLDTFSLQSVKLCDRCLKRNFLYVYIF